MATAPDETATPTRQERPTMRIHFTNASKIPHAIAVAALTGFDPIS